MSTNIRDIPLSEFRRRARAVLRGNWPWLLALMALYHLLWWLLSEASRVHPALGGVVLACAVVLTPVPAFICRRRCVALMRGLDGDVFAEPGAWRMLPKLIFAQIMGGGLMTVVCGIMGMLMVSLYGKPGVAEHISYVNAILFFLGATIFWLFLASHYGMMDYLWVDQPEMGAREARFESNQRMRGACWRFVLLRLSFLGWSCLGALVARLLPYIPVRLAVQAAVALYMFVAQTAMYEAINGRAPAAGMTEDGPSDDEQATDEGFESEEDAADEGGTLDVEGEGFMYWQEENNRMPFSGYHGQMARADRPAMTGNEVAAWDVLNEHGFSRVLMAREGLLEDYRALGVSPVTEARWRADYIRALLESAREHPQAADRVALLAAEYGDETALLDAVEALDAAVTTLPAPLETLPAHCGRILDAAEHGAFEDRKAVLSQAREALTELVSRIENLYGQTEQTRALLARLEGGTN